MSTILIILIALGIATDAGCLVFIVRIYYVVRNKGYANPLIVLIFPAVTLLAFVAGVFALFRSHRDNDPIYVTLFMVGPVALATVGLYIGAKLLPRKARVAGARRILFPYRAAGWILLVGGASQFLYFGFSSHWKMQTVVNSVRPITIIITGSIYCFYLAKRSTAPSADQVQEEDKRPPVLYLRAFTYEEQEFVTLPNKEAAKYTSNLAVYLRRAYGVTLEQYFSRAILESIGPFEALGNPLDYAPPEGAFRNYERDENWQERFLTMARAAACIIIQVGDSRNLQWEFETLKRERLQEKIFIFTPPKRNKENKKLNTLSRFEGKFLRFRDWIKGTKRTGWSEFAAGMRGAGYEIEATEPPAGSVVSMSREGAAMVIASGAQTPAEFVAVMIRRLKAIASPSSHSPGLAAASS